MIRSMTAFAGGERITPWGTLGCELRSVNHRFLEVGVRLPEELRALEPQLRERVAARISRGKLELGLRLRAPENAQALVVDERLVEQLGILAQRLGARFPQLQVQFTDLLQLPGVLQGQTASTASDRRSPPPKCRAARHAASVQGQQLAQVVDHCHRARGVRVEAA
ncbi:hypothetical protein HF319_18840, partial [Xanthomonas sp. Kuri4-1]